MEPAEPTKYRYPGAPPFSYDDRNQFFGRKDDIDRFYEYVHRENLSVLMSRSGLGKSSLLNAGLVPKLLAESNYHPICIKFSSYGVENSISPVNLLISTLHDKRPTTFLDDILVDDQSLWYHLKSQSIENGDGKGFMLIFDQFEYLFTFPQNDINEFKYQLASLLTTKVPLNIRNAFEKNLSENPDFLTKEQISRYYESLKVKMVIAIRSDKLELLSNLQQPLTNITVKQYKLSALDRDQAEEAILFPASIRNEIFKSSNFDYSDEALDLILDYLSTKNKLGVEEIESSQLQILCQHVEENLVIKDKKKRIEASDLKNLNKIFQNYYYNIIEGLSAEEQTPAQRLLENGLIYEPDQRRLLLYEGQIYKDYNVKESTLRELVDKRLLRAEPHFSGGSSYELSHNTLVAPILKAKKKHQREEARIRELEEREQERIATEQKRRKRFRRRLVIGLAAFTYFILITGSFIWQVKKNDEIEAQKLVTDSLYKESNRNYLALKINKTKLDETLGILELTAEAERANAEELEKSVLKEQQAYSTLKEQERQLRIAYNDAKNLRERSDSLSKLATQSYQQLQQEKVSQIMKNAKEQWEIKNYNAAKLLAFHANSIDYSNDNIYGSYVDETNDYIDHRDYPMSPLKLKYSKKFQNMAFSDDESLLMTYTQGDYAIVVWNVKTGEDLMKLPGHISVVNSMDINAENSLFASGSENGHLMIWNANEKLLVDQMISEERISSVRFNPGNTSQIAIATSSELILWDVDEAKKIKSIAGGTNSRNSITFSNSGNKLAFVSFDNSILIYDFDKEQATTTKGHSNIINCLAFSKDDLYLASGSNDNNVVIWDAGNGQQITTLEGHIGNVTHVQFGNIPQMASCDDEGYIKLWSIDLTPGTQQNEQLSSSEIYLNKDAFQTKAELVTTLTYFGKGIVKMHFLDQASKLATLGSNERQIIKWSLTKTGRQQQFDPLEDEYTVVSIQNAEQRFGIMLDGSELVEKKSTRDSLYQKGIDVYSRQRKILIYKTLLSEFPEEQDAIFEIAEAYLNDKNYKEAAKFYHQYVLKDPYRYNAWFYDGFSNYQLAQYDESIKLYNRAIALDSSYYLGWMYRGLTYMALGKSDEARFDYRKVIEIDPKIRGIWNYMGNTYYYDRQYLNAIGSYKKETVNYPDSRWPWSNMASSYRRLGDNQNAIINYQKAIDIDPYFNHALDSITMLYVIEQDYIKAFESNYKLIDNYPDKPIYLNNMADIAIHGKVEYTIKYIDELLENFPEYQKRYSIWNRKGLAYFINDDYENAISSYKKGEELEPESLTLTANMGYTYAHSGNKKAANEYFKRMTEKSNESWFIKDDHYLRAYAYLYLGELEKAQDDLRKAESFNKINSRLYRTWACYKTLKGDRRGAVKNLQKAYELKYYDYKFLLNEPMLQPLQKEPEFELIVNKMKEKHEEIVLGQERIHKFNMYIKLAREHYDKFKYDEALENFRKAYAINPTDEAVKLEYSELLYELADEHWYAQEYRQSNAMYRQLKQVDPQFLTANEWNEIGNDFYDIRRYEESIFYYKNAIELDPKHKWAYANLGNVRNKLKSHDQAKQAFYQSLGIDPVYTYSLNGLGLAYMGENNSDSALNYFSRALEIDPSYKWSWYNMGRTYKSLNKMRDAIYAFTQAHQIDSQYISPLENLYLIYSSLGKMDSANLYNDRLLIINPNSTWANNNLGYKLAYEGDSIGAIGVFKKVISLDPNNEYALGQVASLFYDAHKYDSAIYFKEKQMAIKEPTASDLGSLSWYYLFVGEYGKALAASEKGYALDDSQKWILTNKANALLLMDRVEEAEDEYLKIKDYPWNNDKTMQDAILKDLDDFERAGIVHPDFNRIRKLLSTNQ